MDTTQQLPKNMTLKLGGMSPLVVKDHSVVSSEGFFGWVIDAVEHPKWVKLFKILDNNGVTFKTAQNILISEIKENYKHVSSLVWFEYDVTDSVNRAHRFSKSYYGRKMAGAIIKRLKKCRNWNDIKTMWVDGSDFHKRMEKKTVIAFQKWKKQ